MTEIQRKVFITSKQTDSKVKIHENFNIRILNIYSLESII